MSYTNFEDYLNRNYKPYGCDDYSHTSCCPTSYDHGKGDCYNNSPGCGGCNQLSKYLGCCCNIKYLIITVIVALWISRCLDPHSKHVYGYLLIIAGYTFLLMSAC